MANAGQSQRLSLVKVNADVAVNGQRADVAVKLDDVTVNWMTWQGDVAVGT